MASTSPETVVLKGRFFSYDEATAAAAISPGDLITLDSVGKAIRQDSVGGEAPRMFARENELFGKGLDSDYAANDRCLWVEGPSGHEVYAQLAAAAVAIVVGDVLESAGDGTLRLTQAKASYLVAGQADGDGDLTFTAKGDGAIGTSIEVDLLNAGTGAVVVTGNKIVITPDTGSNTAADVVIQVLANAAASILITALAGGDGSTEPGIGNGQLGGAGVQIAQALKAVDNSGGGSKVGIHVKIL